MAANAATLIHHPCERVGNKMIDTDTAPKRNRSVQFNELRKKPVSETAHAPVAARSERNAIAIGRRGPCPRRLRSNANPNGMMKSTKLNRNACHPVVIALAPANPADAKE